MTAPRHERLAQQVAELLIRRGDDGEPSRIAAVAARLAEWEAMVEANTTRRIMIHADRCTTEPTTFEADRLLVPLLTAGEVAFSLRPWPSTNDSPEVVLYGSPQQLRDLATGIDGFVDEFEEPAS